MFLKKECWKITAKGGLTVEKKKKLRFFWRDWKSLGCFNYLGDAFPVSHYSLVESFQTFLWKIFQHSPENVDTKSPCSQV